MTTFTKYLFAASALPAAMTVAACEQVPLYGGTTQPAQPAAVATAPAAYQEVGDVPMPLSELIQIEAYLTQLGYQVGPIDGRISARTRAAIGAFEQSDGHSPTGFYTPELLAALQRKVDGGTAVAATPTVRQQTTSQSTAATTGRRVAGTNVTIGTGSTVDRRGGSGGGSGGGGGGSGGGGGGGGGGW